MRNALVVVLAVLGSGCPSSNTCGPGSCGGCCTADGVCHTGYEDNACGAEGTGCSNCAALGAGCTSTHACLIGAGTGGGTGGAGGAGAGGTGGGRPLPIGIGEQQLISGSRLKAIRFISAEGAQAPYGSLFWDKQLGIACSPATGSGYAFASYYQVFTQQDLGNGRCYPSLIAYDYGGIFGAAAYRDGTCTQPLSFGLQSFYTQYFGKGAGPPSPMGIFSPTNVKYGLRSTDGGLYTGVYTRATLHTGALFTKLDDGGCRSTPRDGGYDYYVLGADVPESEFAEMTVVVDP